VLDLGKAETQENLRLKARCTRAKRQQPAFSVQVSGVCNNCPTFHARSFLLFHFSGSLVNDGEKSILNPPFPPFSRVNSSISPFSKGGGGDLRCMQDSFPRKIPKSHLSQTLSFLIFIILTLYFGNHSEAAFRDSYLGAKSMAMGGAYTALADDVDGILVNPAGISMIKTQQISATMAVLHAGLSDESMITQNIVGYAYKPNNIGSLGVVWKRLGAGELYYENTLALSYARSTSLYLTKSDEKRRRNLSLGGTLKLMNWDSAPTIDSDGRTIEDLPGWTGINFDLGFVIWPSENTPVALSFQNLRKSDIASSSSKIKENLSFVTRMGVAAIDKNRTWVMDLILKSGEIDLKIGLERRSHNDKLFLRTGIGLENLAWGMNYTIGAGYKPNDSMRIDYAFVYPINTILNTLGSHRISIVYSFGEQKTSEKH
jgi:hypothetical protein